MSEYQYYEFRAVDRPLTAGQMRALRAISTRAAITPTSFTNHYEWGDLKADPRVLLEKYFDAFVYVADWGTRWCMLRLPKRLIDLKTVQAYRAGTSFSIKAKGEHVILDFAFEADGGDNLDNLEEDGHFMPSLVALRSGILHGDFSSLYLGWLLGVQAGEVPEHAEEPPVPAGLARRTAALASLGRFLSIDEALLASAADKATPIHRPSKAALKKWVRSLPQAEKDELLARLMRGDDAGLLGAELLRRFEKNLAAASRSPKESGKNKRRSAGDLLAKARRSARKER